MPNHAISRRAFLRGATAASLAGALGCSALRRPGSAPKSAARPNVVIIFTDDQGYQDVGCFNSPLIRTPHLDGMAREGMRFTDFYSAASVCSPSRAALMTGCYPARISMQRFITIDKQGQTRDNAGVLFPNSPGGLHPDETTIADLLKAQGYATGCVGKWHLGHLPQYLPMKQGFDSYFGIPYSNDMVGHKPPLMRDDKVIELPVDQNTLTKRYAEEAVKFINEHAHGPFFLYLAHSMPHIPLFASKKFNGGSSRGLYGDVIEEIDWSVGEILKALKNNGVDDKTLVVFTSDNGPWLVFNDHGGSALPLRQGKQTIFEGGMREPCIMRWPGKIPAGSECGEVASTIDLLPTIANLVGARLSEDRKIDGKNIWPLMAGKRWAKSPHKAYFYYRPSALEPQAVRCGKWKFHLEHDTFDFEKDENGKHKIGKNGRLIQKRFKLPESLFDLEANIGETTNLAAQNPKVVAKLRQLITNFDTEIKSNTRPPGPPGDLATSPASFK